MADKQSSDALMHALSHRAEAFKLSQTLASRLKFAGFKVSRGLEAKSFREVADIFEGDTSGALLAASDDSKRSDRFSLSPPKKRHYSDEQDSGKRARVSVTPESENEAVELLMALSAHSTRASCSPEPELPLPPQPEHLGEQVAERLRASPSTPNRPPDSAPAIDQTTLEEDTQAASTAGGRDTPDTVLANDSMDVAETPRAENLEHIAQAMIDFVVVAPSSPTDLNDAAGGDGGGAGGTLKANDSAEETEPQLPPPSAQKQLPSMKRFSSSQGGPIAV